LCTAVDINHLVPAYVLLSVIVLYAIPGAVTICTSADIATKRFKRATRRTAPMNETPLPADFLEKMDEWVEVEAGAVEAVSQDNGSHNI
jgi:hypothetical protein